MTSTDTGLPIPVEDLKERLQSMPVPDRVVMLRSLRGWSQEDLAEQLHIGRGSVSSWEAEEGSERHHYPGRANRSRLAMLFGVPPSLFVPES